MLILILYRVSLTFLENEEVFLSLCLFSLSFVIQIKLIEVINSFLYGLWVV